MPLNLTKDHYMFSNYKYKKGMIVKLYYIHPRGYKTKYTQTAMVSLPGPNKEGYISVRYNNTDHTIPFEYISTTQPTAPL